MDNKDASMLDVSDAVNHSDPNGTAALTESLSQMNVDGAGELDPQSITGRQRSRSTLIFDDDDEISPYSNHHEHGSGDVSDSDNESTSSTSDRDSMNINGSDQEVEFKKEVQDQFHQVDQPPVQQPSNTTTSSNTMVPVDITWQQGGTKAYVTGSFTGWRKMIGLVPVPGQPGVFYVKLQLPPGTHRFRFIVDNELRFSDYLPTATDQMGNFVNYLEVIAPATEVTGAPTTTTFGTWDSSAQSQQAQQQNLQQNEASIKVENQPLSARSRIALQIEREPDEMGDGFSRFHDEMPQKPQYDYTQDIPAVFTDPTVMEQYYLTLDQQQNNHQNMAWLTPPQLPPHLENVILNSYSNSQGESNENTSGALPIPNHVILNHLATSSIKHNTLCVASIVRYRQKYVTQILYAPLQ
ncbi:hypothetical protein KAFR_0I02380 [Kazachstania africana CBS 2517]|uniref:Association with the SNF1 complex (ASC) domain-containing protein n=1 Tax=Kazachstania africana (strain ATCC 22294 / BCRC 22015 / CBS 2517 / CECT 1963 / NBRC 1671 / NRRL Y-8276) TaxID=1071382 RepID=H2B067_KAZAF|nr:hypothetical protein KAFR_0I02380 [Kazachstania africana CBS 2517]CCF60017.1 hypothetical protein KAFR_0I02380 [Kazachstania africana CBS 2517]